MKYLILSLFLLSLLYSCHSESENPNFTTQAIDYAKDFIIFGQLYNNCTGDCRKLYLLYPDGLFLDADASVPLENTAFQQQAQGVTFHTMAKDLLNVPEEILNMQYDSSTFLEYIVEYSYYVRGKIGDHTFEFEFDATDLSAAASIRSYCNKVEDTFHTIEQ